MIGDIVMRSELPEFGQYKTYSIGNSNNGIFVLYDNARDFTPFSCVQEILYYFPTINIYDLSSTIIERRVYGVDVSECFLIDDNFMVLWLGWIDSYLLDYFKYGDRIDFYHQTSIKRENVFNGFRDRIRK